MANCPECDSGRIRQSRRKGIAEKVFLTMISLKPFRCERCDFRFYRWSFATKNNSSRQATTQ